MKIPIKRLNKKFSLPNTPKVQQGWDRVINRFNDMNISIESFIKLGEGCYGCVYAINDRQVVKLTKDSSELHTMAIVMKYPHPSIVKVIDVFAVKFGRNVINFIIEEKLDNADYEWKLFANLANEDTNWITPYLVSTTRDNIIKYYKDNVYAAERLNEKFDWLDQIAHYFQLHKIKFADIHYNNIMKKKDKHILIDLGCSRSPKQDVEYLNAY